MSDSEGSQIGGWLRQHPNAGYALAQVFFVLAIARVFSVREADLWWPIPDLVMLLLVLLLSLVPALVVGVVDGFARLPHLTAWAVPLRAAALLLIILLSLYVAIIGVFLLFFDLDDSTVGTYLGTLAGMETALALSWGTAMLVGRIYRARQRRGQQT